MFLTTCASAASMTAWGVWGCSAHRRGSARLALEDNAALRNVPASEHELRQMSWWAAYRPMIVTLIQNSQFRINLDKKYFFYRYRY